jgi:translation initiation factor 2B subunit (eIF-2B alpha/beta/delta family)
MKNMGSAYNLPVEFPREIQSRIDGIRSDNTSGAAELGARAAETLMVLAENAHASSTPHLTAYLSAGAYALIEAQPTMAPIFNLANQALLSMDGLGEAGEIGKAVSVSCRNFISRLKSSGEEIGKIAAGLIRDGDSVMTHSYSSTVLKALLMAKAAGKRFDVACTESRPMLEGVELARKLGLEGIKVRLVVDAAAFSFLPEVQMVLVGADSLSPQGVVNKIGTSGLALAAVASKVHIYALCGFEKFLPSGYPLRLKEPRNPVEVLTEAIDNVLAINYYFDLTPLEHLSGVVTEEGLMMPDELKGRLEGLRVHRSLY